MLTFIFKKYDPLLTLINDVEKEINESLLKKKKNYKYFQVLQEEVE